MRTFFLMVIVTIIVFLIYKGLLVVISKLLNKLLKIKEDGRRRFDFLTSVAIQLLFVSIWFACMDLLNRKYGLSNLFFYISFCLVGIFCVIWCYFSWDAEHIWVKPCKASKDEKRIKKIVIYSLILVFVLCQGYFQTLHVMDNNIEINILFSITNYSVIVATIAFDRVMNQICQ